MKPTLTPKLIFLSSAAIYIIAVLFSLQLVTSTPWLGVGFEFDANTGEASVAYVEATSPADGILEKDMVFSAIADGENIISLTSSLIKDIPFNYETYSQLNHFYQKQTFAFNILANDSIIFLTSDNASYPVKPVSTRPVKSLPILYWLHLLVGGAVFFVGMAVLALSSKDNKIVNVFFALAWFSFLILSSVVAVYTSREIAIDGQLFYALSMVQYYSSLAFVAFFISIFCFYPMRAKKATQLMLLLIALIFLSLLHVFQVFESLLLGIYALFYLMAILGIFFITLQYNYTRGFIVERASLRWLVYALITGDVLFFIISIIPLVTVLDPIHKQFFYWVALLCIYLGVALGLKKYKLFKLELWALYSWVWMFGSLVVLGLAVLLVTIFNISSMVALLFSVLVIGWLYFPLRHWLWENYAFGFNRTRYQDRLPELLEIILSPKSVRSSKEQWEFLLRQVYNPVLVMHETDENEEITIKESGAVLHVPEFNNIPALGLAGVERGSRLFNANDVNFLESLMTLFKHAQEFKGAYEQGVHEERTRIARDLHDDVAAKLLTLIHKTEGTPQEPLAREALVTLRESINSLGGKKEQDLDDILRELQIDIMFRLDAVNLSLTWEQDRPLYQRTLSSRQATNFKRVTQEIITNVLKHANATAVSVDNAIADGLFTMSVCDNGKSTLMKDWVNGRGVNNIRTRLKESGGTVRWNQRIIGEKLAGTCVDISIPI